MEITLKIELTPKQSLAHKFWTDLETLFVLFGGGTGGGKIVANNGVVLTPFGWKKGINLKVGDLINNPDGTIQKIIQIKPEVDLPLWRVYFSDNTYTNVAEDHLWQAWKGRDSRKIGNKEVGGELSREVVETKTLQNWIQRGYKPQTPVCKEQAFNRTRHENNKLDAYLLGVLLGDGCITTGNLCITCDENDKEHYKNIFGVEEVTYQSKKTIRFIGNKKKAIIKKLELYKLAGTNSLSKFIQEIYKFSSIEERYKIVQGLLDTDGYKPKSKNGVYYYTISPKLADDMAFILRSLGAVVTVTKDVGKYKKNGERVICNEVYNLYIKHPNPDKLFRMERKKIGRKTQKIR